ncbi:MAG: tyrosyl-tRNA synthetase [Chlamydiales bacterium]|jgi:tyrosyl-tRNA synthetase
MTPETQHSKAIDAQMDVFRRGAVDLIDEKDLRERIGSSLKSGEPLRIKFGMDPSSADLHIGHSIPLMKLRDLQQQFGHTIVLIVGDATAMVGDPSGRNKLRPQLSRAQVDENLLTYTDQAAKILDMERTEVRRNSEWFDAMGFEDVLKLTSRMTVAQMIERDTFQERMQAQEPIGIHEFLYPLMQGWDSVQVSADLEFGGTDQLFNLLVGRRLQEQEGQRPQICLTTPLINGLDGRKMSKSYGNAIGLTASARDMYFESMRIDDEVMASWFTLLTRIPQAEMDALLSGHPREAKVRLAREVTAFYHGAEAASEAGAAFDREVRDKQIPDDLPEKDWPAETDSLPLANLLRDLGLTKSTSEARRVVDQGGVRLDGEVVRDPMQAIQRPAQPLLVQVGKRRFTRIKN